MVDFSKWWEYDPKELVSQVYWLRGQLPPSDKEKYQKSLDIILDDLAKKYPNQNLGGGDKPKDDCVKTSRAGGVSPRPKEEHNAR